MDIGGSLTKIAYYSVLPLKKIVYDGKGDHGEQIEVSIWEFPDTLWNFRSSDAEPTLFWLLWVSPMPQ